MPERPLHTERLHSDGEPCSECRSPLAPDQRYCLQCGTRQGPPRVDPLATGEERPAREIVPATWHSDVRVPSPRVAALLALAMLVTGIALGAAAGPNAPNTLASAPAGVIAVVAQPAAAAALPATTPVPPPITDATPAPPLPASTAADTTPTVPATPATPTTTTDASTPTTTTTTTETTTTPAIKHIWLIVLSDQGYQQLWGTTSTSPYFSGQLRALGTLLPRYYAVGHGPLVDGVALLSGQEPSGQVPTASSLPDQLTGAGLTWKAYMQDLVPGATATAPSCPAPTTPRDPFVYFKSISGDPVCGTNVVGIDQLAVDLATPDRIPAFSYISPATDLATAQPFVADAVQKIMATTAYTKDGLIVVTSDEAPATGPNADARQGGGRVGALMVSPFFKAGATLNKSRYDHISLLRTIENLFGLSHLGDTGKTTHKAFGPNAP